MFAAHSWLFVYNVRLCEKDGISFRCSTFDIRSNHSVVIVSCKHTAGSKRIPFRKTSLQNKYNYKSHGIDISFSYARSQDDETKSIKLTSRERRFIKFASVEFDGQLYMTPQDFLDSVVEQEPRRKDNNHTY